MGLVYGKKLKGKCMNAFILLLYILARNRSSTFLIFDQSFSILTKKTYKKDGLPMKFSFRIFRLWRGKNWEKMKSGWLLFRYVYFDEIKIFPKHLRSFRSHPYFVMNNMFLCLGYWPVFQKPIADLFDKIYI